MTPGSTAGPRHPWLRSISARLILLYIAAAAGTLTASTFFLSGAFIHLFNRESIKLLEDKLDLLQIILREYPETERARHEQIQLNWSAFQKWKCYARVLDDDGQVLIETPVDPGIRWPSPGSGAAERHRTTDWVAADGRRFIFAGKTREFGHHPRVRRRLQVALDVTEKRAVIEKYLWVSVAVLAAAIAVSAALATILVWRGMRPIWGITGAARRMTASQLHERLDLRRLPTELYELGAAFNDMLARLEDSFNRLSQFSADLAHELRTPINNLVGEADVALTRERTAAEYRATIESSIEEFQRLARMIDSLLFLARADNPRTRIEKAGFDAREEAQKVLDFYDAVAEEQGIALSCEGSADLDADPVLLRRAISNLLSNALRFTPRGGTVGITIRSSENGVEIAVSDTGTGIPAVHLPRIFDRFYMVDAARTHQSANTGLGLSIVKSIMDLHGGSAAIESDVGKGTTITLRFPPPPKRNVPESHPAGTAKN
ncbi:MAG: heavy metal sensor histidine kinase [Deltaproteobacteria bacterium]|nr:heavy metal sensor histidine kinase [Deltaproteobacteria bacterium]